LLAISTSC